VLVILDASNRLGVGEALQPLAVRGAGEMEVAFAAAAKERAVALLVLSEAIFADLRHQITDFAARGRLPAVYGADSSSKPDFASLPKNSAPQPTNLVPSLPSDRRHLLTRSDRASMVAGAVADSFNMSLPPSAAEGWRISITTGGIIGLPMTACAFPRTGLSGSAMLVNPSQQFVMSQRARIVRAFEPPTPGFSVLVVGRCSRTYFRDVIRPLACRVGSAKQRPIARRRTRWMTLSVTGIRHRKL
jgi:hypothetical protein